MNKLTIYIVDDYLLNRIAQKSVFENDKEIKVIGDFSSARECIKSMAIQQADIVLMDLELDDMNGIEATSIIKEKYPSTKVIALTSFDDENRILAALSVGISGYIIKDRISNLKKIIKTVAKGVFWMDTEVARKAFSKIPKPDIRNFENLYSKTDYTKLLTNREKEVLKLIIEGKTNSQIAKEIIVSTNTAKAHVGSILEKLSVKDRVQAAVKAIRANIV